MSRLISYAFAIVCVAAVQTAAIAYMVYDHNAALNAQRRITLRTIPVDPRDLFRGDYVILRYPISRIARNQVDTEKFFGATTIKQQRLRLPRNAQVRVTLQLAEGETWQPIAVKSVASSHPENTPTQISLTGRLTRLFNDKSTHFDINYGMDRFFVPEGQGKAIERAINDKKVSVEVAVNDEGRGTIRALLIDGKPAYTVSLFN